MHRDDPSQLHDLIRQLEVLRSEMLSLEAEGFSGDQMYTRSIRRVLAICFTILLFAATIFESCRSSLLPGGCLRLAAPNPT